MDEVIPRDLKSAKAADEGSRSTAALPAIRGRKLAKSLRDAGEEMRGCGRKLLGKVRGLGRRGNDGTYTRCGSVEPGPDKTG